MLARSRKLVLVVAAAVAVAGSTGLLPGTAIARRVGGWPGGGWHGGGGWGWGGFGVGLGTGLLLGAATAPYYGGYYGYGPAYAAYGGPYGYAGGCYIRGRWVRDGYGHRVWRRVRVC